MAELAVVGAAVISYLPIEIIRSLKVKAKDGKRIAFSGRRKSKLCLATYATSYLAVHNSLSAFYL